MSLKCFPVVRMSGFTLLHHLYLIFHDKEKENVLSLPFNSIEQVPNSNQSILSKNITFFQVILVYHILSQASTPEKVSKEVPFSWV